uniref:Uncharacterized protein n=1 Tax=Sphaerodactylus townsendi TaxID=933632 RepID=A0ACB8EEC5_9SAUR
MGVDARGTEIKLHVAVDSGKVGRLGQVREPIRASSEEWQDQRSVGVSKSSGESLNPIGRPEAPGAHLIASKLRGPTRDHLPLKPILKFSWGRTAPPSNAFISP